MSDEVLDKKDEALGRKRARLPRREFLSNSAKLLTGAAAPLILTPRACDDAQKGCPPTASRGAPAVHTDQPADRAYDVIVIGSGFGATVAVTTLLERKPGLNVLILERGVWWLSPDRPKPDYLAENPAEPTQYYARPD